MDTSMIPDLNRDQACVAVQRSVCIMESDGTFSLAEFYLLAAADEELYDRLFDMEANKKPIILDAAAYHGERIVIEATGKDSDEFFLVKSSWKRSLAYERR